MNNLWWMTLYKKRQQARGCRVALPRWSCIISSWMWLMKYHVFIRLHSLVVPSNQILIHHVPMTISSIHQPSIYEDSHSMPSHVWLIKHHNTCGAAENATPRTLLKPNTCLRQAGSGLISSVCLSGHQIPPPPACRKQSCINISSATHHKYSITMVRLWKGLKVGVWRSNEGSLLLSWLLKL